MTLNAKPNLPYCGVIRDHHLLSELPAKVYFVDLFGREQKERYKWKESGLSQERLLEGLQKELTSLGPNGIPRVVVAFPHVTTAYRWGDPRRENERETNLYAVGRGKTPQLDRIILAPFNAAAEIGCPLELEIARAEMRAWADASSVPDYLKQMFSVGIIVEVFNTSKLREHLENF